MQIVELKTVEQLESCRLAWHALWKQTPGASFFQSLDWLLAYLGHSGQAPQPRVLAAVSGGKVVGIVPLVILREATRLGRFRVLGYPLSNWGTFFGPIGPNPTATLHAAVRHVRDTPRDWDLFDLRWVDKERFDRGRTASALDFHGVGYQESVWKRTAVIDTAGSWDEYWMTRSPKLRNNIRRQERRLKRLGRVEFVRYRPAGVAHGDDDPRWDLFESCLEVARCSWQSRSTTGNTLSDGEICDFIRQTHADAARLGCLDLNLLKLDGRPVAFGYNYRHAGHNFGLRTGYDPQYGRCGVGAVLLARLIRGCFEGDDMVLDLGPESPHVKRPWLTHFVASYRYVHHARTAPRAQLLRLKHWMTQPPAAPAARMKGSAV